MGAALRERSEGGRGESESDSSNLSRLPEDQAQVPAARAARSRMNPNLYPNRAHLSSSSAGELARQVQKRAGAT